MAGRGVSRSAQQRRTDQQITTLLAGIPQTGATLGRPTAPVTLQFFGDLECLTTKNWVIHLLPAIIEDYVRRGLIQIEYRAFKTDTLSPATFVRQQTAALAASAQNKLWNYIETFYHEQGREYTPYATESYIDNIATQVPGLNLAKWHQDRQTGRRSERVVAEDQAGRAVGFHDTPAFLIGRTGGRLKDFTGRIIYLEFAGFRRMKYPVALIDAQDLKKTIKELVPTPHRLTRHQRHRQSR